MGKRKDKDDGKGLAPPAPPATIEPASDRPEELEAVWDDDIATTFAGLLPKHQAFLLKYIQCWNAAEAYRHSHNPMASDHVASANGSRMIAREGISSILAKFADQRTEALFLVQKTYNEAAISASKPIFGKDEVGQPILVMEQPDYAVRIKAAEALAKLHGLNAADKVEHSGEVLSKIVQVELPKKDPIA